MEKLTREALHAIYKKQSSEILMREVDDKTAYLIVSMGDAGLNAGAKAVFDTLSSEVNNAGLRGKVMILQSEYPELESSLPVVEVVVTGEEPVFYGNVNEEFAKEIISSHIVNKKAIDKNVITLQSTGIGG